MAEQVKVQGTISRCLEVLQVYADQYGVMYRAYFSEPNRSGIFCRREYKIGSSGVEIPIFFNWRSEYKEYDNSF